MAPTTPSNSRACSYTPPVADGRGRSSQPPLRKVRTRIEASAAQRARGKDLIMAHSSRTMREDLPDTAVAEARLRKDRLCTTGQQIGGRGPLLGPRSWEPPGQDSLPRLPVDRLAEAIVDAGLEAAVPLVLLRVRDHGVVDEAASVKCWKIRERCATGMPIPEFRTPSRIGIGPAVVTSTSRPSTISAR